MKVLVVAEYYPRAANPVLGVWTHRQTLAARGAGVDVRVLVLHRPLPPLASVRAGDLRALRDAAGQPPELTLDGLPVEYVRYLSPPRPWSYRSWGAWATWPLRRAIRRVGNDFDFDLIHAHNAVPAGDAVRRALPGAPLVVSAHGGDLYGSWTRGSGGRNVSATFGHARLVLANSAGTARRAAQRGARGTRIVHLGTDIPAQVAPPGDERPLLVSVGHLVARKRHADVIAALPSLRRRHPQLRYVIVGDGPERQAIERAARSAGVADLVELRGRLDHEPAVKLAQSASVFVLPSVDEAFGVAYIEAMAGAVPAIGCRGEDGPEEIAAAGGGIELVRPGDLAELTETIDKLLSDPARRMEQGRRARETVTGSFSWEQCGRETAASYADALAMQR